MLNTCICAKSLDTQQPRISDDNRCPTCGHALATADATTAIQTETPLPQVRAELDPAFEDVARSIRIKSQAARVLPHIVTVLGLVIFVACMVAMGSYFLVRSLPSTREEVALTQVKGPLTTAVQAYFLKHNGEFPATLDKLLERDHVGGPYLENADALLDPWGNRYQYDIKGPRNNGAKPDIWTIGPDDTIIGNWLKAR
jgi:hypothetical protein